MDNDSIFISGQILTALIALFSYTITHIPLIKKKKKKAKLLILIAMSFVCLFGAFFFFWGGGVWFGLRVFCDRFSFYLPIFYIWLLGDFHRNLLSFKEFRAFALGCI